ncbi:MAG: glycerol-3-phosphate dehydrogenase/oxidase [Symploca sp. SIO2E6]|nr:glycerol-3-phosphate dehydrogenase/oxidase [Symploca sp. SIO2E6]
MKRNLVDLTRKTYDIVVIGGGIYGAWITWEASLRGLAVALVEKADFGGETSANSLKIIHGGLRYLQQADLKRMRESIHERTTLMGIAPHLVHPLPVLLPTYGHGIKGKEVFAIALAVNDLISCDRNRLQDQQKHIPCGRIISPQEYQKLLPSISLQGLTGGALFYDAQVYNSERLTISLLRSAEEIGATVANYVEVTGFLSSGNSITGVQVQDVLTGDNFDICAKTVVNSSGPWMNRVLNLLPESQQYPQVPLAKAMNLVIRRQLFETYAVGIPSKKNSRFLFIAPWRGKSIVGTSYAVYEQQPDDFSITEPEIQEFIDEINQACPSVALQREDIDLVHGGLLSRTGINQKTGEPILARDYQLWDYSQEGWPGLISVVGVKYTTARDVAKKVVDRVFRLWGQKPPPSLSVSIPVHGGKIEEFATFLNQAIAKAPYGLGEQTMRRLVYNYGSTYPNVLKYLHQNLTEKSSVAPLQEKSQSPSENNLLPSASCLLPFQNQKPLDNLEVIKAEVIHGIREEMAQKLTDVVLRRTELGTAGYPGDEILNICAQTMGEELGWSLSRIEQEVKKAGARTHP